MASPVCLEQQQAMEDGCSTICSGRPIVADWDLNQSYLVDGLGLCSPNRWWPSDRFVFEELEAGALAERLHVMVRNCGREYS